MTTMAREWLQTPQAVTFRRTGQLQQALTDTADAARWLSGVQNHLDAGGASWTARTWARIAFFALERLGATIYLDRDAAHRAEGEAARLAHIRHWEGATR